MTKPLRIVLVTIAVVGCGVAVAVFTGKSETERSLVPSLASGENPLAALQTSDNTIERPVEVDDRPVPSKTGPWPAATAVEQTYAFGRMQVMQEGEHSFRLRNTGDAELKLQAGKSTCQCTLFKVEKESLAPGEETRVIINWKPKSRDPSFRHGGPVYTNDPKNPKLDFAVEGAVDVAIEVLPDSVWDAGNVYRDRPGVFKAAIASKIKDEFTITSIKAASEHVTFKITPMETAEKVMDHWSSGYEVEVTVAPDIPSGLFTDEATITLGDGEAPMTIPIRARKYGAIKFIPSPGVAFEPDEMLLKLGNFAAGSGRSVKLTVIVENEGMTEPLKIVTKESRPSYLTAEIEPVGPVTGKTQRCNLTIAVPPGRPRERFDAENPANLTLTTNHPLGETVSINVLYSTN